jgi:hypothetical protein
VRIPVAAQAKPRKIAIAEGESGSRAVIGEKADDNKQIDA